MQTECIMQTIIARRRNRVEGSSGLLQGLLMTVYRASIEGLTRLKIDFDKLFLGPLWADRAPMWSDGFNVEAVQSLCAVRGCGLIYFILR